LHAGTVLQTSFDFTPHPSNAPAGPNWETQWPCDRQRVDAAQSASDFGAQMGSTVLSAHAPSDAHRALALQSESDPATQLFPSSLHSPRSLQSSDAVQCSGFEATQWWIV
jgi:hypothetical protein